MSVKPDHYSHHKLHPTPSSHPLVPPPRPTPSSHPLVPPPRPTPSSHPLVPLPRPTPSSARPVCINKRYRPAIWNENVVQCLHTIDNVNAVK